MKQTRNIALAALISLTLFACKKERFINEPGNLVPKTVDQDASLPSITVNGVMLHSEAFGHPDSTIIVCLHGGPGDDYRSMLNARELADHGYRVVFYDQRGSGLSQRLSKKSYTDAGAGAPDLMYSELLGVIEHYRTDSNQKVYFLGHSWGAMLASGFSGKYPHVVQGLVLAEPGGLKWKDVMEYVKASQEFSVTSEQMNDLLYLDQFITGKEDQHEILDYKRAMLASRNDITGENNNESGSFWRFGAVISEGLFEVSEEHEPDFSKGAAKLQIPVLFLYSEKNKAYGLNWSQRISAVFKNVSLEQVKGTGHGGMFHDKKAWSESSMPSILDYFNSL